LPGARGERERIRNKPVPCRRKYITGDPDTKKNARKPVLMDAKKMQ
jgi:hypothetical protein